ncbi:MAG: 1L-myo-inositol 1-phosphate cytidylyltransferase / CDP-L-myo-inositol myo-inositolphosphotransferase [Actinomycetota bacterium]|nr:1L-myo-inositol 1-phosphate cytidylyltransferase / CDP-L-myo-inositol myo-inositolphosphotransferase [Actinomycetota bacterium]
MRGLLALGLERIIVVVGHDAPMVADIVNETAPGRARAVFAERWADGNGASLAASAAYLEEDELFVLVTADHLFSEDALEGLLRAGRPAGLIDPSPSAEAWAEGTRVQLHESRAIAFSKEFDDPSIDCGAFLLPKEVFAAQKRAELDGDASLAGAVTVLAETCHVEAVPVAPGGWWLDVDTPEDLESARRTLRRSLVKNEDGPVSRYLNRPVSTRLSMILSSLRPNPDLLSYLALLLGVLAAWLLAVGNGVAGGALVLVGSILDGMDGEAARLQIRGSASGALLDGVLDRAADAAILTGLAIWAARNGTSAGLTIGLCAAAVALSILSMASKDRITALGMAPAPEGALAWLFGGRDGRLLVVTLAAVLGHPLVALAVVAVTSGFTLVIRLVLVRRASVPLQQAR